jgi:glycosyltransferase involved in cell wall biosynthesis
METNLNIVHLVLGKGNPNRMNGVNKVAFYLAETQSAQGHQVAVWGITKTPDDPVDYEHHYALRLFKDRGYGLGIPKKLKEALTKSRPDTIFHLHGGFIPEFVTISKWLSKLKRPFIITSHGAYNLVAMKTNRKLKSWYFPLLEKKIISRACKVHLVGESEMEGLGLLNQQTKGVVIPNGQAMLTQTPHSTDTNDKFIFGFLGRVDIYTKGLDLVLNALEKFTEEQRNQFEFWIVGSGKEEERLREMVHEKGLNNTVIFKGARYGHEKIETIAHFNAFVHPSRNEGMPGAVLEAAVQHIPCVVSEETNVGDYIRAYNAGFVLDKNDPLHLAKVMEQAVRMQQDDLNQLGNNAYTMIEKEFKWEKIAWEHLKVYEKMVSE